MNRLEGEVEWKVGKVVRNRCYNSQLKSSEVDWVAYIILSNYRDSIRLIN